MAVPTRNVTYASLGTFSESTLFIGDSLTYQFIENYLLPNKFIGGASYMAAPCTTAKYFLSSYWVLTPSEDNRYGVACNTEFQDLSFGDALAVNKGKYDTVFFLLGSNNSSYVTRNQYLDAIDLILRYNPDATIYLQTVPNSPTGAVETARVNGLVREAVSAMHDLLMREESHLPFRFGFEAKTAGDESEYHEDVLPLYTDSADIEAFGDEDALGHDDEEYDYAPVSGLSEDEDFLPGADSYTMLYSVFSTSLRGISS